jgi:NAD(P)-dependent dehydrogenase (short-subunit alcohol dehydrogenase family)
MTSKTALAAGSGLGAGIAGELAAQGWKVAASSSSGKVEEPAKTVAFLLSDGAGYIAGQSLRVDGGITREM